LRGIQCLVQGERPTPSGDRPDDPPLKGGEISIETAQKF